VERDAGKTAASILAFAPGGEGEGAAESDEVDTEQMALEDAADQLVSAVSSGDRTGVAAALRAAVHACYPQPARDED
jgi:hypothetical protein